MVILTLNPGSSTLKFGVFDMETAAEQSLGGGMVERIGTTAAALRMDGAAPDAPAVAVEAANMADAAEQALRVRPALDRPIDAVACRVVHGGRLFHEPTRVTPTVLSAIRALAELAPLHNPASVGAMESAARRLPEVPVYAVFDTAFHSTMPDSAALYALPADLADSFHLRRYGFHGISHRYVSAELLACTGLPLQGSRLITCHLGSGSSVCAIRDGKSIDTSMGLTPMEGLVMGTRSGDIDPGLVLHLIRARGLSADEVDDALNHRSGLLGVSGRSADVRDLEAAASQGDSRAELALELFAYRGRKYIGAYSAALGGAQAIAFTAGIGEHSAGMRERICRDLGFMGVSVDSARNRLAQPGRSVRISGDDSTVSVWVIPTDEDLQMSREVSAVVRTRGASGTVGNP